MSIIPLPSAGIPTSGQPWKWKCLIALVCFSYGEKKGQEDEITPHDLKASRQMQGEERLRNVVVQI